LERLVERANPGRKGNNWKIWVNLGGQHRGIEKNRTLAVVGEEEIPRSQGRATAVGTGRRAKEKSRTLGGREYVSGGPGDQKHRRKKDDTSTGTMVAKTRPSEKGDG